MTLSIYHALYPTHIDEYTLYQLHEMHSTNPFHIKEQKQVERGDDAYHWSKEEPKPTEKTKYIHTLNIYYILSLQPCYDS